MTGCPYLLNVALMIGMSNEGLNDRFLFGLSSSCKMSRHFILQGLKSFFVRCWLNIRIKRSNARKYCYDYFFQAWKKTSLSWFRLGWS